MKLIDKSALVAEIEKLYNGEIDTYTRNILDRLKSNIDTLEVKEMNFVADYIEEIYSHIDSIKETADRMTSGNFMHHKAAIKFSANTIAEVLELMGFKAQKGE